MSLRDRISRLFTTKAAVDSFYQEKEVFFILGMGRSGTRLLCNLLDQDENSLIFHEPVKKDFEEIVERNDGYIEERKERLYHRIKDEDFDIYGEVNSNLRYHAQPLSDYFSNATLIQNVRDGRDVVRSVMSRGHYTGDGIGHHSLRPEEEDPLYSRWGELTRFEKVCWLWRDAVEKAGKVCEHTVYYEKWTRDYHYFKDNILQATGTSIPEDLWADAMNTPDNETSEYAIPHWKEWGPERVRAFKKICGEQMRVYGYT